jgi:hypothetical protein
MRKYHADPFEIDVDDFTVVALPIKPLEDLGANGWDAGSIQPSSESGGSATDISAHRESYAGKPWSRGWRNSRYLSQAADH